MKVSAMISLHVLSVFAVASVASAAPNTPVELAVVPARAIAASHARPTASLPVMEPVPAPRAKDGAAVSTAASMERELGTASDGGWEYYERRQR